MDWETISLQYILHHVWLSWWAKTLYLIFAGCIFSVFSDFIRKNGYATFVWVGKEKHEQEEELNNERLRFFTNITHELRTPLTLILGPLEDLQEDKDLLPYQQKKISIIHNSAIRLLNLINQILEFQQNRDTKQKTLCK